MLSGHENRNRYEGRKEGNNMNRHTRARVKTVFLKGWQLSHKTYGDVNQREEVFYLTTHTTHFNYGYMASDV